jgi:uncharacterized protein YbjT (DUF2867 family)
MILVIGATGNVGRNVVAGLPEVRAMVRDPAKADLPEGVEVVRGDLFEPETVRAAAEGVEAVFLVWPGPTAEGAAEVVAALGGRRVHPARTYRSWVADHPGYFG